MIPSEAAEFLKDWDSGRQQFTIYSSGSTGSPKPIVLERKWMEWSARHTAEYLQPKAGEKMLCCLPLQRVGGLMMLVRARVWQMDIIVREPSVNPLLDTSPADIVSLTPFQIYHILKNPESAQHLLSFREVLIGGGEISPTLEGELRNIAEKTGIRHSYGMSETYSHIALRHVNGPHASQWFTPFQDVVVEKSGDGTAMIRTPFSLQGLKTSDLIETGREGEFRVLGRVDFVINSGGVKLQAEEIERKIHEKLQPKQLFLISSVSDAALGRKLVLVCENMEEFEGKDLGFLREINPYAVPKNIVEIKHFPLNEGGKTDRQKVASELEKRDWNQY